MSEHADYEIDGAEYFDWDFYNQHIRPTVETLQYVEDRRTIGELIKKGVDPSGNRVIDFYFTGPMNCVVATVRILDERYYSTEDVRPLPDTDDGTAALVAHKQMPLDALHVEAMSHRVLAAQQGVIYDGWGTSLVGATPEPGGV